MCPFLPPQLPPLRLLSPHPPADGALHRQVHAVRSQLGARKGSFVLPRVLSTLPSGLANHLQVVQFYFPKWDHILLQKFKQIKM